jgi:hypothetical protein
MSEAPHRTFRHDGHRVGLAGALLGVAALSGAGTLAGVLPAIPTSPARPVAGTAALGLPVASTTGTTSSARDRNASIPGAAPFPRTSSSPITAIFT